MYQPPQPAQSQPPPPQDQNSRNTDSNHHQGMHFHVHQCVCTSPLYNPYRQTMITPYVQPPVPPSIPPSIPSIRPYNLAHYQYTSYNIPSYNIPIYNSNNLITTQQHQIQNTQSAPQILTTAATSLDDDLHDNQEFTKFLEHGCLIAEKIAIRNQHRPCFKNIQNLCNRTKNEILKPSHTVSNIHSQGIPWATKDFIYAFVRLINCWHMLKGYLQVKDGTLGNNIDRELTHDFKACYTIWESNTKDLAEHMIRIFTNLDNNVSNPLIINQQQINKKQQMQRNLLLNDDHELIIESNETSPRNHQNDDESDDQVEDCVVYMKPGSYNVPKKLQHADQSIEFFDTAKNIQQHYYKKLEVTKDKEWLNAITASTNLINKNNVRGVVDDEEVDNVRRWLYHDHFDQQNLGYNDDDDVLSTKAQSAQQQQQQQQVVTLLQRVDVDGAAAVANNGGGGGGGLGKINEQQPPRCYRKLGRATCPEASATCVDALKMLLDELEKTDFNQLTLNAETTNDPEILKQITQFSNIIDETIERIYPELNLNEMNLMDMDEMEGAPGTGNNNA